MEVGEVQQDLMELEEMVVMDMEQLIPLEAEAEQQNVFMVG